MCLRGRLVACEYFLYCFLWYKLPDFVRTCQPHACKMIFSNILFAGIFKIRPLGPADYFASIRKGYHLSQKGLGIEPGVMKPCLLF